MGPIQAPGESRAGENWEGLNAKWEKRTQLAAEWLQDDRVVVDIGCGLMVLEQCLSKSSTYIPMDVVRRDGRTVVLDLNKDRIPCIACDTAVLLGVLEYMEDVSSVLKQLSQFPKILLSYNHVSLNDMLWKLHLRPKHVTWKNRHTKGALQGLLRAAGLQVMRERNIRVGEVLYEVRPTGLDTGRQQSFAIDGS